MDESEKNREPKSGDRNSRSQGRSGQRSRQSGDRSESRSGAKRKDRRDNPRRSPRSSDRRDKRPGDNAGEREVTRVMADTQSKSILNVTNLATIAILVGLILFVIKIASVFGIFLFSFLIAFLLFPIVEWLTERKVPRIGAIFMVFVVLGTIIFGLFALVVPAVIAQSNALIAELPQFVDKWEIDMAPRIEEALSYLNTQGITVEDIQTYIRGEVVPNVQQWGVRIGQTLMSGVQGAVGGIVFAITVPIIVFYLLLDARRIRESLMKFAPTRTASEIQGLLNRLAEMLNHYIRGQLKLSFLMFVITTFFLLVFGVPHALLLGFLAGITEIIPIIGPIIALIPALLIAFFIDFDTGILAGIELGWVRALIVFGFYMALQYVEGNIMVPRIMGKDLNLHPLTVMFSLLAGGYLAGFFGMILALPFAASLKVIFETYYPGFIQNVEDLISRRPRARDSQN